MMARQVKMLTETQDKEEIIARVAALDIGKAELVCYMRVPHEDQRGRRLQEVETYSTMTRPLVRFQPVRLPAPATPYGVPGRGRRSGWLARVEAEFRTAELDLLALDAVGQHDAHQAHRLVDRDRDGPALPARRGHAPVALLVGLDQWSPAAGSAKVRGRCWPGTSRARMMPTSTLCWGRARSPPGRPGGTTTGEAGRPKPRVYELAAEFNVGSKAVMDQLKEMGEFVRSASSIVEHPVAQKLREQFYAQAHRKSGSAG